MNKSCNIELMISYYSCNIKMAKHLQLLRQILSTILISHQSFFTFYMQQTRLLNTSGVIDC